MRTALSLPISNMKLASFLVSLGTSWMNIWSSCANNKLFAIYQHVTRVLLVVKLQLSMHFELVVCVSPTLTCYQVTINLLLALVGIADIFPGLIHPFKKICSDLSQVKKE